MVQPEWPVPPCWAQGRFPKVQETSESGTVAALCPPPASLLPASVFPAWANEQDRSPHWLLRGHRDPPFRVQGSHTHQVLMGTGMPHARCLWPWGVPHAGQFFGHRDPTKTEHSMGTEFHSAGYLWAQRSLMLDTLWAQRCLMPDAL